MERIRRIHDKMAFRGYIIIRNERLRKKPKMGFVRFALMG